ncbi:hypothetical protein CEUSTIGMA_g187.t1 [Chlamydomonas eustigma]|uniref:Aquaporin n=1 Tax=Chlamydomonas eustigma TaxID=1157962 RepID=A0A250WPL5_9CHLO|nr:hypothetical protein CEUSTIGMA_g187.t1 [Chlamydomonas eustigma]|eukprot:GAX72731.1 hypothetical protein CEUSTIGMA_g187.t1 [Chlamydomonas eustigma]
MFLLLFAELTVISLSLNSLQFKYYFCYRLSRSIPTTGENLLMSSINSTLIIQADVTYDLGTKCLTELLGTMIGIYLGCSVIASAILPKSKGQSMGFGWISLGYGLAFFVPGVFFGHVSANLNPAICIADLVMGKSTFLEFLALSASEIVGAFLGAVCTWLHWIPHFKTVPEPPAPNMSAELLRKRDALPKNAMDIASYDPHNPWLITMKQKKAEQQQVQQQEAEEKQEITAVGNLLNKITSFRSVQGQQQDNGTNGEQQQQQTETSTPGLGIMDDLKRNASMWMSNVKYYTVWHDKFVAPEDILTEEKLPLSQTTSVAMQGSVPQGGLGSASPLPHNIESVIDSHNVVSPSDISFAGHLQTVQEGSEPLDMEMGDVTSGNDQTLATPEIETNNDARVTRSALNLAFQQEHLDMLMAPQLQLIATTVAATLQTAQPDLNVGISIPKNSGPLISAKASENISRKISTQHQQVAEQPDISIAADTGDVDSMIPRISPGADLLSDHEPLLPSIIGQSSSSYPATPPKSPFETVGSSPLDAAIADVLQRQGTRQRGGGGADASQLDEQPPAALSPAEIAAAAAEAAAAAAMEQQRQHVMALYDAAVIADQNAKLTVFTTRPAVYAPPFNWLSEFMATVMLVVGVNLFSAQTSRQGYAGQAIQPFFTGMFICCQVMGLGGTTGFSVNPARDLGPRIAHAVLPIPNKGGSEWYYGWIPVTAALVGGVAGAGLFMAIDARIWPN